MLWVFFSALTLLNCMTGRASIQLIKHVPLHHNCLTALFRDCPSEPVPEENFWTLRCKGRLTEADTPTIWMGATPSGLSSAHLHHPPHFYRLDALPATQQQCQSTEGSYQLSQNFLFQNKINRGRKSRGPLMQGRSQLLKWRWWLPCM